MKLDGDPTVTPAGALPPSSVANGGNHVGVSTFNPNGSARRYGPRVFVHKELCHRQHEIPPPLLPNEMLGNGDGHFQYHHPHTQHHVPSPRMYHGGRAGDGAEQKGNVFSDLLWFLFFFFRS